MNLDRHFSRQPEKSPDKEPEDGSAREQAEDHKRTFRIHNFPNIGDGMDVVVAHGFDMDPRSIAEQFQGDVPREWGLVSKDRGEKVWCRLPNRGLFAKKKFKVEYLAQLIDYKGVSKVSDEENIGYLSVLNEFAIAEIVREIIASAGSQAIANKHGFLNLEFIKPLAATVNNGNNERFVIYDEVDGLLANETDYRAEAEAVCADLHRLFLKQRINPVDLRSGQMLVSDSGGEKKLYLTDIEAFQKVSEEKAEDLLKVDGAQ